MVTRAKNGINKPKVFLYDLTILEPTIIQEALAHDKLLGAVHAEYDALIQNNTWSLVPLPPNHRAVGCKWVFKLKRNSNGSVSRYKARLVAKRFHQQAGVDFLEIFSPMVKTNHYTNCSLYCSS